MPMSRTNRDWVWWWLTAVFLLITANPLSAQTDPTPTPDRLAAPPTVAAPTMADDGAQLYWLHCQPCHGDRGQGLTDAPDDEWRAQYPPDHQYCWESGCHGERPYENGFSIPHTIPALIGEGSLANYGSMAQVYAFMRAVMPRQAPASLTDEEYLAITAFLARAHGLSDGAALTEADLSTMVLNPAYMEVTERTNEATAVPAPAPASPPTPAIAASGQAAWVVGGLAGLVTLLLLSGGILWLRHNR